MIPYGISDFREVKIAKFYYIDKTHFIPKLEQYGRFLYLIRPRRFGKSLLLNMLAFYYDRCYADEYEPVFGDTWIYNHPTPEKNSYCILKFDFSAVSTVGEVDENFSDYCNSELNRFIKKYKLDFTIDKTLSAHSNLRQLFDYISGRPEELKVYVMIDEYDNFINNLLVHSENDYKKLVSSQGEAIYKEFFKLLKALTGDNNSPLKRMFFTGVSPLALFDVTSGSNIGKNITNEQLFNDIVGVTKDEFQQLLKHYKIDNSTLSPQLIDDWYNNYRFNEQVVDTIYNTDMILYYVDSLIINGQPPRNLVDINVRTDYSKLRYLINTNNKLNGNFNVLQRLFGDGHVTANMIKDSFSAFEVTRQENFISLLYYLGLITIDKVERMRYYLKIPNQTIRIIMAEYLQDALEEAKVFNIDLSRLQDLIYDLAFDGSLELFHYLADKIKEQTSIRDYIQGESLIKGLFIAYLNFSPFYAVLTEKERNKGYVDILLQKAPNITDELTEYVIELTYLTKAEFSEKLLESTIKDAATQIKQYRKPAEKGIIIVFRAWEMVYCEQL